MNNMKNTRNYFSDEELERLIAMTEAEPMLHPPREFKNEIIGRIHRKRKNAKNLALFSYSMKVFAATAAVLTIMLVVPDNIRSEDGRMAQEGRRQEEMEQSRTMRDGRTDAEEQAYNGNVMYRLNEKMDDYCSQLNNRLNKLVGMEDYEYEKEEK